MAELRLENSIIDDRYELARALNHGSYAEIFLARDTLRGGESCIVKALNAFLQGTPEPGLELTLVQNFQNEAIALDKVRHPNIIRRLGHGTASDLEGTPFHYLVLEYMAGGDLLSICRGRPLEMARALYYFEQVCCALAYAHSQHVIHRDIKPNNLLLSADKATIKIADFGVAKISPDQTEEITRVGTNVYAPPEHHPDNDSDRNPSPLTPSADIYSLAKSVYTVVTGRSPARFARQPISSLPDDYQAKSLQERLLSVLSRATADEISSRFQSVDEFWTALSALGDPVSVQDPEATLVRSRSAAAMPGLEAGPSLEVTRPDFRPHTAPIEGAEFARPAQARIVIDLPGRLEPPPQPLPGPGQPLQSPAPALKNPYARPQNVGVMPDSPVNASAPQAAQSPVLAVPIEPPGVAEITEKLKRQQDERASLQRRPKRFLKSPSLVVWLRRVFIVCLAVSFIGIADETYLYFANPDHHLLPIHLPFVGDSHKDGSIAGASEVNIRSEPGGASLAWLAAGTRVRVLDSHGNWIKVKVLQWVGVPPADAPDSGWVDRRYINFD